MSLFLANEWVRATCISLPHRHAGNSVQPGTNNRSKSMGYLTGMENPSAYVQLDLQHHLRSPITSTATPVSAAAAKQQHQYNDNQDQFHVNPPLMAITLFAAHRIFQSADGVLHLTGSLVGLAFSFQLLVAEDLSGGFFHGSLGLLCRTPYPRCLIDLKVTASSMFCSR